MAQGWSARSAFPDHYLPALSPGGGHSSLRGGPQVALAPLARQADLALALAKALLARFARLAMAEMAAHAFLIFGALRIRRHQRAAAGVAQDVRPFLQPVLNAHSPVEHEAGAIPKAFLRRHFLEIFQDASLQVVNLVIPLPKQEIGGFFAADTAGAEHRDALVVETVPVLRL